MQLERRAETVMQRPSSKEMVMPWSREFEDPVPGCRTLRDAANYIKRLPKAEQELPAWQAAVEALIMAAEGRGPMLHATVGMRRAMGVERPKLVKRKRVKKYRIVG